MNGSGGGVVGDVLTPAFIENAASQFGMDRQAHYESRMMRKQFQFQKKFAQMGIRWKVADAIAAGIHPLYALGANTISYQPSRVGGPNYQAGYSKMGQNISRAMKSMHATGRRMDAIQHRQEVARAENMELQNRLLQREISRAPAAGPSGSSWGLPGQGDVDFLDSAGNWVSAKNYEESTRPRSQHLGVEKAVAARSIAHVDEHGWLWFDPSQTASEAASEGPGQIGYWGQKWATGIKHIAIHKFPWLDIARNDRQKLRKVRKKLQRPPGSKEWHWDPGRSQWRLETKSGKFYTHRFAKFKWYGIYKY